MSHNAAVFLRLTIFTCLYVLIKTVKLLKKRTLKTSFFSRKQLEGENLAEVQFLIDSRGLVNQSNYLTASRVFPYKSFLSCSTASCVLYSRIVEASLFVTITNFTITA